MKYKVKTHEKELKEYVNHIDYRKIIKDSKKYSGLETYFLKDSSKAIEENIQQKQKREYFSQLTFIENVYNEIRNREKENPKYNDYFAYEPLCYEEFEKIIKNKYPHL